MGERAGLKRPGHRYNTEPAKLVEGFKKAVSPHKAQPGQALTLQRSKPVSSSLGASGPPARLDSYRKVRPDGVDSGLDPRKVTPGTAFHHAAAGGASEASHEQGFEKSVEKSV
ncbi:MAG: hypothetical protein PVJ86_12255 [Phycisphaerales bacterium]